MLRVVSFLFGFGLIGLWAAGLATDNRAWWIMYLDFAGGVCAFLVATVGGKRPVLRAGVSDLLLGLGLLIVAIVALTGRAPVWQGWGTFVFACIYLLLGAVGIFLGEKRPPRAEQAT
jgi:hypothetical protein